jgi:signal transduction histidine kinase
LSWTGGAAADPCLYVAGHDVTIEKEAAEALRDDDSGYRLQKLDVIEQLAGGIAHDFNNSFQNILASMELVRKLVAAGRGSEAERFVPGAMNSAQRAAALAQRWLDFSRSMPPSRRRANLSELISRIGEVLRSALPSSIHVDLDLSPDAWNTYGDENLIESMILTLVLHARNAMPDGGDILIRTGNADIAEGEKNSSGIRPGQYICISVIDSGAGLDKDAMLLVFDDAVPVPAERLGLNVVRRFARQMGGDATIRSDIGAGTTVTVWLPRHLETGDKHTGL